VTQDTHDPGCPSEASGLRLVFGIKVVHGFIQALLSRSAVVHNFHGECLKALFHDEAADACDRARCVGVRVVVITKLNVFFVWVPLSESVNTLLVLHLLCNDGDLLIWNILPLNSNVSIFDSAICFFLIA